MRVAFLTVLLALAVATPARAETVIPLPLGSHFTGVAAAPGQVWVAAASGRRGRYRALSGDWTRFSSTRQFRGVLSPRSDGGAWLLADSKTVLRLGAAPATFGSLPVPFRAGSVLGTTASDDSFVLAGRLGRFLRVASDGRTARQTVAIPRSFRSDCFPAGMDAGAAGSVVLTDHACGRLITVTPSGGVSAVKIRSATVRRWPNSVLVQADGTVWFTASKVAGTRFDEVIARRSPDGTFAEVSAPGVVDAGAMAEGPDGSVWVASTDCTLFQIKGDAVENVPAPFKVHHLAVGADGVVWLEGYSRLARFTSAQLLSDQGAAASCDVSVPHMSFPDARGGRIRLAKLRSGLRVRSSQAAGLTGRFVLAGRHVYVHKVIRHRGGVVRVRFPRALLDRAAHRLAGRHKVSLVPEARLYDPSGNGGSGASLRVVR